MRLKPDPGVSSNSLCAPSRRVLNILIVVVLLTVVEPC